MADDYHPRLNPVRAFQALHGSNPDGDPDTSLSDFHDYEPSLEFDDCELVLGGLAPLPPELLDVDDVYVQRSASDGTIEENFEEELAAAPHSYAEIATSSQDEECFSRLASSGLVEVVGDDELGRRIIIVSAYFLPPSKEVPHDKLLQFLMYTLDKYVEQDYSLVYFHYGLASTNKPNMAWMWKAYRAFDRKYKKNLKALYLVHPTPFIRFVWQMLRPAISVKFGQKMKYVNYLHELQEHLWLDPRSIPDVVLQHDKVLLSKNRRAAEIANQAGQGQAGPNQAGPVPAPRPDTSLPPAQRRSRPDNPNTTHQFGVSLEFILQNNPGVVDSVPPIVRYCVEYLSQPDALETEGIFRRSTNVTNITRMVNECNSGQMVNFKGDPHCAAVLLKHFLRDLDDPILTHQLYEEVIQFPTWPMSTRPKTVKVLLLEKLPLENYKLLKYIVKFLYKVADRSCLNKMTLANLAVVFGPNFQWPPSGQVTLKYVEAINNFTEFILVHQDEIFII